MSAATRSASRPDQGGGRVAGAQNALSHRTCCKITRSSGDQTHSICPNERAVYPSKEGYMRNRLYRSVYLLSLLAAFVLVSGAGRKVGGF